MKESHLLNKEIVLGIFMILITLYFFPITGGAEIERQDATAQTNFSLMLNFDGTTLYVGGGGPGNYSNIQEAVDNASNEDTIFVFNGTYYENIIVDKSIRLIGENMETTVIDGNETEDVISIFADGVNISGFTVQKSGNTPMYDACIEVHSNDNKIFGNIVCYSGDYAVGIYLNQSNFNNISENHIFENGNEGVFIEKSTYNIIQNNNIHNNGHCSVVISESSNNIVRNNEMYANHDAAVSLWPGATQNEITENTIYKNPYSGIGIWWGADENTITKNNLSDNPQFGIKILYANKTTIKKNTIMRSEIGIILQHTTKTSISYNNLIENTYHAWFDNSSRNKWIRNYWDDHNRLRPKRIDGERSLQTFPSIVIRWFNFDWFPSLRPHDII